MTASERLITDSANESNAAPEKLVTDSDNKGSDKKDIIQHVTDNEDINLGDCLSLTDCLKTVCHVPPVQCTDVMPGAEMFGTA